ncbi:sulfotransferase [Roseivirga sp. BDSF3-8]|uniref:sulfotransferase family protein n=1 Tax=Roseivirga sp. BDSF3-8 TaxID=3241598 RepID=UPI003531831B
MVSRKYFKKRVKELYLQKVVHPLTTKAPLSGKAEANNQFPPFFIIGSGRSGTTLLRKVLSNHASIIIPPETDSLIIDSVKYYLDQRKLPWIVRAREIISMWQKASSFSYWNIELEPLLGKFEKADTSSHSLSYILHAIYLQYAAQFKPGAFRWGDKTPYLTFGMEWVKMVFPQARFIHMLRDGRAVVSSKLKAKRYNSLEPAAHRWNESLELIQRFEKKHGPGNVHTVKYEDLVANPEQICRQVCQFLALDFQPSMLSEESDIQGDIVLPHHANVFNNINTDSLDKWKKHLSPEQVNQAEHLMARFLTKYNYY